MPRRDAPPPSPCRPRTGEVADAAARLAGLDDPHALIAGVDELMDLVACRLGGFVRCRHCRDAQAVLDELSDEYAYYPERLTAPQRRLCRALEYRRCGGWPAEYVKREWPDAVA